MRRALARLDHAGLSRSDWVWGGGTVLMLRYQHRVSRDIYLFVGDVQHLSYLSPRLMELSEPDLRGYGEQANHLRIEYPEGEVDFLAVAPVFPRLPAQRELVDGIDGMLQLMPDKEILGQKLHYRAAHFAGRDLYDFIAVTRSNPALLADIELREIAVGRRDALRAALSSPNCATAYGAIQSPRIELPFQDASRALLDWLA